MKIAITPNIEINVVISDKEIQFICPKINLNGIYDIATGEVKGEGSKGCSKFIIEESKKILIKS